MNRILSAFLAACRALAPSRKDDQLCCVLHRDTLRRRFGDTVVALAPIELWHLWPEGKDPWGPISAVERAGVGTRVDAPVPDAWHSLQTWTGEEWQAPGHTALVYAGPAGSGMALRLDSADKRPPDGGVLDDVEDGPAGTITTWEALTRGKVWRLAVLTAPR